MDLFCLLFVPLFYLFRRSVAGGGGGGGVWALLLGSITAIFQFFLGNLVEPGGFGLSRWMSGFVDVVGLPVLAPIIVYALFVVFRFFSGNPDFANFALLWLIPVAVLRALNWSSLRSPILLILVPLLWTALATGIPLFIKCIMQLSRWYAAVLYGLCILALPALAVSSYWAFFSQRNLLGCILLLVTLVPMMVSVILDFVRSGFSGL